MAAKSSLLNMVLCLTGVCLICAAILGVVYVSTQEPIAKAADNALKASLSQVLPEGVEISEAKSAEGFEYYEGLASGELKAYAVKSTTIGFGGPLVLMVGVYTDGTVVNTSVLSHSETPGLGAKCTSDEGFMQQWKGFSGKLAVKKDGGDVDAITASTITSRAYTKAVEQAVNFVLGQQEQIVPDSVSGASVIVNEQTEEAQENE